MSIKSPFLLTAFLFALVAGSAQTPKPVIGEETDNPSAVSPEVAKTVRKVLQTSTIYADLLVDSVRLKSVVDAKTEELQRAGSKGKTAQSIRESLDNSIVEYDDAVSRLAIFRHDVRVLTTAFDGLSVESKRIRTARALFEKGKIAEANAAMNTADMEREMSALLNRDKRSMPKTSESDRQLRALAEEWRIKANIIQVFPDFDHRVDSTDYYFRRSIRCQQVPAILFEYAGYLYDNDRADSALVWFQQAATRCLAQRDSTLWVASESNLGALYYLADDYDRAEKAYLTVLDVYNRWNKATPGKYDCDIAEVQNNLGSMYYMKNDLAKAEKYYVESLRTYRDLPTDDRPKAYDENLANMQFNLGIFYMREKKDYGRAEKLLNEAFVIRKRLAEWDPHSNDPQLASTYENLGMLYGYKYNFERAESAYLDAKKIWERLAKDDPETYESNLATVLGNLGELYGDMKEYERASTTYLECLEIIRRLVEKDPKGHESNLATTLNNYGVVLINIHDLAGAEKLYLEALEIRQRLAKDDPEEYKDGLASVYNNLGVLYYTKNDLAGSEKMYVAALELYRQLAEENPTAHESDLAMAESNLALFYSDLNRVPEAIAMLQKAVALREKQYAEYPDVYTLDLAFTINNLGYAYLKNNNLKEAYDCLKRSEQLKPDNSWVYRNWACYYALQNELPKGIANLRKAADMGYDEPHWVAGEKSLDALRGLPEWAGIVEKVRKNAGMK